MVEPDYLKHFLALYSKTLNEDFKESSVATKYQFKENNDKQNFRQNFRQ